MEIILWDYAFSISVCSSSVALIVFAVVYVAASCCCLVCCVFYMNREESTSEYIKLTVEVYVGTRSVVDFYLFRSVSICFKGEGAEVFVPDVHEMFVGVRKNVFVHFSVSGVSGRTYRYSLDSRYCMTFDD